MQPCIPGQWGRTWVLAIEKAGGAAAAIVNHDVGCLEEASAYEGDWSAFGQLVLRRRKSWGWRRNSGHSSDRERRVNIQAA